MDAFSLPLLIYYAVIIAVVCVYGLHRYWMLWLFARGRHKTLGAIAPGRFESLPRVTVQLPMFNEPHVAERVIEAACAINYPGELLQIQVLDDSTDEGAKIAERCCARLAAAGHDIEYLHRANREGFKAGALAEGLKTATGQFIAVFDADFVPPAEVLHQTIHQFTDPAIGMVQTRWTHLNRGESLLTRIQAMFLDGHFVIEQAARAGNDRWFNFNGTAGVWRRTAIEDAGGWHHDTLTEDTDLSYRAQLKGWRFRYLSDVCCPAEVPPTVSAFLSQQHRWNKGLIQTAIKLLPAILKSDAPLRTKIEAWFHLTSPLVHLVILLLVTMVLPAMFISLPMQDISPWLSLVLGTVFLSLGAFAACAFYLASQRTQGLGMWRTLLHMPALLAVGIGISVVNSRAVWEAICGKQSPFVRTPKYNGAKESAADPISKHRRALLPAGTIEVFLGLLMLSCFVLAFLRPYTVVGAPFLLLFGCGFLAVGIPSLRGALRKAQPAEPVAC